MRILIRGQPCEGVQNRLPLSLPPQSRQMKDGILPSITNVYARLVAFVIIGEDFRNYSSIFGGRRCQ